MISHPKLRERLGKNFEVRMAPIFNLIADLQTRAKYWLGEAKPGFLIPSVPPEPDIEKTQRPVIIKEDMGWRYVEGTLTPMVVDQEEGDVIPDEEFEQMVKDGDIPEELANDPAYFKKVLVLD